MLKAKKKSLQGGVFAIMAVLLCLLVNFAAAHEPNLADNPIKALENADVVMHKAIFQNCRHQRSDPAKKRETIKKLDSRLQTAIRSIHDSGEALFREDPDLKSDLENIQNLVKKTVARIADKPEMAGNALLKQARNRLSAVRYRHGCVTIYDRVWGLKNQVHEVLHLGEHLGPDEKLSEAQWKQVGETMDRALVEIKAIDLVIKSAAEADGGDAGDPLQAIRNGFEGIRKAGEVRSEVRLREDVGSWKKAFRRFMLDEMQWIAKANSSRLQKRTPLD